jgi:hypothetical protein
LGGEIHPDYGGGAGVSRSQCERLWLGRGGWTVCRVWQPAVDGDFHRCFNPSVRNAGMLTIAFALASAGAGVSLVAGCATAPTVVHYHCGGFGVAKPGDYPVRPAEFDRFLASAVPNKDGLTGSANHALATVIHRGRTLNLVSPTNTPVISFHLLVVEDGVVRAVVLDGACNLSCTVSESRPRTRSPEPRIRNSGSRADRGAPGVGR